jgi:hypothetical protein
MHTFANPQSFAGRHGFTLCKALYNINYNE